MRTENYTYENTYENLESGTMTQIWPKYALCWGWLCTGSFDPVGDQALRTCKRNYSVHWPRFRFWGLSMSATTNGDVQKMQWIKYWCDLVDCEYNPFVFRCIRRESLVAGIAATKKSVNWKDVRLSSSVTRSNCIKKAKNFAFLDAVAREQWTNNHQCHCTLKSI